MIIRSLEAVPTLPAVGSRLLDYVTGLGVEDSGHLSQLDELTELIRLDPALTSRLLRMANCQGGQPVLTVPDAFRRLGVDSLRSSLLSVDVAGISREGRDRDAMDRNAFWRHSLGVAFAVSTLAEKIPVGVSPEAAFTCGLLHDIGKLALCHALPKSYARIAEAVRSRRGNFSECERRVVGTDHSVFGRRLADHWSLPRAVQDTIWLHHQPVEAIPPALPNRKLVAAVGLANTLVTQLDRSPSGNVNLPRTADQIAIQMGISLDLLSEMQTAVEEGVAGAIELLGLDQPNSEEDFSRALASANVQLGHINERLRRKVRGLASQAGALEHIRSFAASLPYDATVADALMHIARTVREVELEGGAARRAVVAYSLDAENGELLAVCRNGSDRPEMRTLRLAQVPTGQDEPQKLAPAVKALPGVVADPTELSDWFDPTSFIHQPLLAGGRWVGGMLLPAVAHATSSDDHTLEALAEAMALSLATVQERNNAMVLSEQLAGASQILAETQDAIAESKTLAAVGEMAAGAAHEMNNPLAVIAGRAQLMREQATSEPERKTWETISDQAQCVSDIISELMEFASPPGPKPSLLDAADLLHQAAEAFSDSSPQEATVFIDIKSGSPLPPLWVDREQILAVLGELIDNAAKASGGQAQIHLSAEPDEMNSAVFVEVRDTGPGMDEQTIARAYTPFFSGQKAGRRRGLGLPKAKRFVEINGGKLWIDSTVGEGTTVCLQLPVAMQLSDHEVE